MSISSYRSLTLVPVGHPRVVQWRVFAPSWWTMAAIVETHNLSRQYGGVLALDTLNLQIPEGAVFGFGFEH